MILLQVIRKEEMKRTVFLDIFCAHQASQPTDTTNTHTLLAVVIFQVQGLKRNKEMY